MQVPPPLTAVLFDLDDTLLDTAAVERRRWARVAALVRCAAPDVSLNELHARYRALNEGRSDVDTGAVSYDDFREARLREALRPWCPLSGRLLAAYVAVSNDIADQIEPLPGAVELLTELRGQGIATAIVTNGGADWQRRKLQLTGIGALVDAVVISAELGVAKPDPLPFQRACELLGVHPGSAMMVGDNPACDIAGAETAGLRGSLHVGPEGSPLGDVHGLLALRATG
jgi:HAD superfamily hydrolase (TIGR01509 family)